MTRIHTTTLAAESRPIDGFTLKRRRDEGGTPHLQDWGVNSEYGVLTDVLLGRPDHLQHLATSSLSRKYLRESRADLVAAKSQHAEMVTAYAHFGVNVHFHLSDSHLALQTYARDSSFMTPYGAVITNMSNPWRRGENFAAIRTYEALGVPLYDMVSAGSFEGGDFNVIEPGCVLIGCGGERTQDVAARQVQAWFEREGWEVRISYFDPYYVHIDVMVVMIAEKLAAVCTTCTEPAVVDWLKAKRIEIIDIPFADTMTLGCNVMSLGRDRVIAPQHSRVLIAALKARGFEVAELDINELSKTGGGIHCLAQALRRDPVNKPG
jgi:N-dimethylarginine dimethylaminohydrolase